jgi:hypothetical protein
MGCPIVFVSKMQTEIALSTTEAKYIALSQAMRDLIPFSNIAKELGDHYHELTKVPKILCRLFEDNRVVSVANCTLQIALKAICRMQILSKNTKSVF